MCFHVVKQHMWASWFCGMSSESLMCVIKRREDYYLWNLQMLIGYVTSPSCCYIFHSVSTDVLCLQNFCKYAFIFGPATRKTAGNSFVCNSHMKESAQFARLPELMWNSITATPLHGCLINQRQLPQMYCSLYRPAGALKPPVSVYIQCKHSGTCK